MKTRTVNMIGNLYIRGNEEHVYRLLRQEQAEGFGNNVTVFTVIDNRWVKRENGVEIYWPFIVAATSWFAIYYPEPKPIDVYDDTGEEVNIIELDIPTPAEISEAEWERMLNDVDTHRFDTETENVE